MFLLFDYFELYKQMRLLCKLFINTNHIPFRITVPFVDHYVFLLDEEHLNVWYEFLIVQQHQL